MVAFVFDDGEYSDKTTCMFSGLQNIQVDIDIHKETLSPMQKMDMGTAKIFLSHGFLFGCFYIILKQLFHPSSCCTSQLSVGKTAFNFARKLLSLEFWVFFLFCCAAPLCFVLVFVKAVSVFVKVVDLQTAVQKEMFALCFLIAIPPFSPCGVIFEKLHLQTNVCDQTAYRNAFAKEAVVSSSWIWFVCPIHVHCSRVPIPGPPTKPAPRGGGWGGGGQYGTSQTHPNQRCWSMAQRRSNLFLCLHCRSKSHQQTKMKTSTCISATQRHGAQTSQSCPLQRHKVENSHNKPDSHIKSSAETTKDEGRQARDPNTSTNRHTPPCRFGGGFAVEFRFGFGFGFPLVVTDSFFTAVVLRFVISGRRVLRRLSSYASSRLAWCGPQN